MLATLAATLEGLFGLGALFLVADHARRPPGRGARRNDFVKFAVYFGIVHALLGAAYWGRAAASGLFALAFLAAIPEVRACAHRISGAPSWIALALLATGFTHAALAPGRPWFPSFAFLILLVCSTDSFAQLTGHLWGRHPLVPGLSPRKTVEGWVGGLAAAGGVALACGFLAPELSSVSRLVLGVLTSLGAAAGDLLFSWIKRRAGIKDFSSILPGHGGVLDRFDSLAVAAPIYVWARLALEGAS